MALNYSQVQDIAVKFADANNLNSTQVISWAESWYNAGKDFDAEGQWDLVMYLRRKALGDPKPVNFEG